MSGPARHVGTADRRARLASRHFLASAGSTVEEVAGAVVGLHATDPVSVYLSALARVPALTIPDVEAALYERRSLLKVLGMRRTMFVVPPGLAGVVDAACTRALSSAEHSRLRKVLESQGVADDAAAWIGRMGDLVVADLRENGEATTRELTRRLPELDIRVVLGEGSKWATEVSVASRVLMLLAIDARIIRARPLGSWLSSQYRWAPTDEWAPGVLTPIEAGEALADLVRRWLAAYGPGSTEDLVWWTGLTKKAVTGALRDAGAIGVSTDDGEGWLMPDDVDEPPAPAEPWVALLPALDPAVMGWKRREWYLAPAMVPRLFDRNGNAGPTVWASGEVVGGWAQRRDGSVAVELLADVDVSARTMIDRRARELSEWFGGVVATPRFRTPLERELSAT